MSRVARPDIQAVGRSAFFTNHMHVLSLLAERPDLRLREIAEAVGITERATHRIVTELVNDRYLTRTRVGSRNRYHVTPEAPLPRATHPDQTVGDMLQALRVSASAGSGAWAARYDRPAADAAAIGRSALLGAVFSAAPAGIAVADDAGRLVAVNPAFCALVGRGEDELIGRPISEFIHPDDLASAHQPHRLTRGRRDGYERGKRYRRPDGTLIWVKIRLATTTDPRTGATLAVAHVTDIDQERRRDHALAEAEERFRSAFDNAPIGMALVALDGRWLKVNRAVCAAHGLPRDRSPDALLSGHHPPRRP